MMGHAALVEPYRDDIFLLLCLQAGGNLFISKGRIILWPRVCPLNLWPHISLHFDSEIARLVTCIALCQTRALC